MFKLDPGYSKRIDKKINETCHDETLKRCLKNRLEIGCTYPKGIEKQLDELEKIVKKDEEPPWWIFMLD